MKELKTTTKEFKQIVAINCDICTKRVVTNCDEFEENRVAMVWMYINDKNTIIEKDICPDCFQNKLIPWIESFS